MYDKIIVPMTLDHGIGPAAVKVARKLLNDGGKIIALHIHEEVQGSVSAYLDKDVVKESYNRAKAELDKRIEAQPDVSAAIIAGHSGRSIVDFAAANKADCIVIGSHKPGLIDYLLGSTAARVVRHAPCAVHVLRNT
jgi:nucleotide-binding universal stress UspA family protein